MSDEGGENFGLQPGGDVKMKGDDFALKVFKNMPCWKKEPQTITSDRPWIKSENWEKSYTMKYLNYQTDSNFINLENPLQIGEEWLSEVSQDLPRTRKVRKASQIKDYAVTKQAITAVSENNQPKDAAKDDEDDDFLDCYGNVTSSPTNKAQGPDLEKGDNFESEEGSAREEEQEAHDEDQNIPRPKKRRRQRKKKGKKKGKQLPTNDNLTSVPGPKRSAFWRDLDNVTQDDKEKYKPVLGNPGMKNTSVLEPRYSYLNCFEQRQYLALLNKFANRSPFQSMTKQDQRDFAMFDQFRKLCVTEYEDFQAFAKKEFMKRLESLTNYQLKPDIARYMEQYYEYRLQRAKKYPRMFSTIKDLNNGFLRLVPLYNEQQVRPQYEMRLKKTLLELGTIPKINLPSNKRMETSPPLKVTSKFDRLNLKHPANPDSVPNASGHANQFSHRTQIAEDPNAEILARHFLPDLIVPLASLKAIFDNFGPLFEANWEIPFTIRTYGRELDGKMVDEKRVIFVDKPLAPKSLTVHEKNSWFHKIAAKAYFLHPWTQSKTKSYEELPSSESAAQSKENVDITDPFQDNSDVADIETFGVSSKFSQLDGNCSDEDSDDEDKLLIDDVNPNPADSIPIKTNLVSPNLTKKVEVLTSHPVTLSESLDYRDFQIAQEQFLTPTKYDIQNIGYRLWNLFNKEDPSCQPLQLIVRTSIHGLEKLRHSAKEPTKLYTLGTKLENQPEFGAEVLTKSEISRDWMSTLCRPGSYFTRVRINPRNQEILKTEIKDFKSLTRDCISQGLKPGEQLGNLYTLFNEMRKIKEPGQYCLQHDAKSGAFVRVLKASKESNDIGNKYDLHTTFNAIRSSEHSQAPPTWNNIDVNLITPWHFGKQRVPGLFAPKPNHKKRGNQHL